MLLLVEYCTSTVNQYRVVGSIENERNCQNNNCHVFKRWHAQKYQRKATPKYTFTQAHEAMQGSSKISCNSTSTSSTEANWPKQKGECWGYNVAKLFCVASGQKYGHWASALFVFVIMWIGGCELFRDNYSIYSSLVPRSFHPALILWGYYNSTVSVNYSVMS